MTRVDLGEQRPDGAVQWFEVHLAGRMVGVEERVAVPEALWRRRWIRVRVAGVTQDLLTGEVAHCDEAVCRRRLWSDGALGDWAIGAVADHQPVATGAQLLVPMTDATTEATILSTNATLWRWAGPDGGANFDAGGLVAAHVGQLAWTRVDQRPRAWAPVDLTAMLSVPSPVIARPRARRIGRYLINGESVSVDSPLRMELAPLPLSAPVGNDEVSVFARRAMAGAVDVPTGIERLAKAVAARVADQPVAGPRTGRQVLTSGRGDCSEHVALFIDACKALGLRSKSVAGLLYLEAGPNGSAFYPHVWATVRVGDRWVDVDPTLGSFPADAARIPLGERADRAMDQVAAGLSVEMVSVR